MIQFPNAKINLGLHVVSKRPDNYHNLETIFYPISLCDVLEVVPSQHPSVQGYTLHLSGIVVDGNPDNNLVIKAWRLLHDEFNIPPIDIYLRKVVPFGAGLGGGSSDAAAMLQLLQQQFQLPLTQEQLLERAAKIGADCPFFLLNKPTLAEGIGNEFSPLSLSLRGYCIVLVKPDVGVSTAEAYSQVTPAPAPLPLPEVVEMPLSEWRNHLVNDFEKSVFAIHPSLAHIKEQLYQSGAIYASMSGSGSSLYGIFDSSTPIDIDLPHCFVWQGEML